MSARKDHSSRKNLRGIIAVISITAVALVAVLLILLFVWPGWLANTDREPIQSANTDAAPAVQLDNPEPEREPLTPEFTFDEGTNSYSYENGNGGQIRVHIPDEDDIVTDKTTVISFVKNELILRVKPGIPDDQAFKCIENLGGIIVGKNTYLHTYQVQFITEYYSLDSIDDLIKTSMATGIFDSAYPNYVISEEQEEAGEFSLSDEEWSPWNETADKHWGADAIHAPDMWQILDATDTQTVRVGVLDGTFYTKNDDLHFTAVSREWKAGERAYQIL